MLSAIAATAAGHGLIDLYVFAVFAYEKVADVDHAAVAVAGDTPLEAGVVGFDGVVVVGGWVPGWARIGAVHSVTPLSVGRVPGGGAPRGHLYATRSLSHISVESAI